MLGRGPTLLLGLIGFNPVIAHSGTCRFQWITTPANRMSGIFCYTLFEGELCKIRSLRWKVNQLKHSETDWNDSIKYRTLYSDTYKNGVLVYKSADNALLWLAGQYPVGSNFDVLMRTDDRLEHVFVRVVRTEETSHLGYTGYGCKVEMTLSEAA